MSQQQQGPGTEKIPQRHRSNQACIYKAATLFKTRLPRIVESIATCKTNEDLEALYDQFKQTMLSPWSTAKFPVLRRYKDFWSRTLDNTSKERSRLYNEAKISQNADGWKKYKSVESLIKKLVKKSKSKQGAYLNTKMGKYQQHREMSIKIASKLIREGHQDNRTGTNSELNQTSFTKHMETHTQDIWCPGIERCAPPDTFTASVVGAIREAKLGRAVGVD